MSPPLDPSFSAPNLVLTRTSVSATVQNAPEQTGGLVIFPLCDLCIVYMVLKGLAFPLHIHTSERKATPIAHSSISCHMPRRSAQKVQNHESEMNIKLYFTTLTLSSHQTSFTLPFSWHSLHLYSLYPSVFLVSSNLGHSFSLSATLTSTVFSSSQKKNLDRVWNISSSQKKNLDREWNILSPVFRC